MSTRKKIDSLSVTKKIVHDFVVERRRFRSRRLRIIINVKRRCGATRLVIQISLRSECNLKINANKRARFGRRPPETKYQFILIA